MKLYAMKKVSSGTKFFFTVWCQKHTDRAKVNRNHYFILHRAVIPFRPKTTTIEDKSSIKWRRLICHRISARKLVLCMTVSLIMRTKMKISLFVLIPQSSRRKLTPHLHSGISTMITMIRTVECWLYYITHETNDLSLIHFYSFKTFLETICSLLPPISKPQHQRNTLILGSTNQKINP